MDFTQECRSWVYYHKKIVDLFVFYLLISTLTEAEPEVVCGSIDIRNSVSNFNQLVNCTVIEGHLDIVLIDYAQWTDYLAVSFPKLREITDYLLMYRVYGLKSLSHIFPNLAVIRGQTLFYNYALVMFEVPEIEDIGLVGLTVIERGAVRLEKNWALCYIDTIDWQLITSVKNEDHFIVENKDTDDCINVCPKSSHSQKKFTSDGVETKQPLCWNYKYPQKVCVPHCGKKGCYITKGSRGESVSRCCADSCLGGCHGPSDTQCIACKDVIFEGRCQPRCPAGTYEYHRRRCITESECRSMKNSRDRQLLYKLINTPEGGKCESECPSGHSVDEKDEHLCQKCDGSCPKICSPITIHSVSAAQFLRGCTVIQGILEIQIRGGRGDASLGQVEVELERSLGNIQEIRNYITIRQSNALTSFSFLKNLSLIRGDYLMSNRYALFVLDNHNLQDIWDINTHPKLKIEKGQVFFHFNPKLCLNKIDEFVQSVGLINVSDHNDISRETNGDQAACNITTLLLEFPKIAAGFAIIRWTNFRSADHRELLSWVVNYREAKEKNVTIFNARDACATDVWNTMDVAPDVDPDAGYVAAVLHALEPFTQYAVYVQTYTISTATRGAVTRIGYFKTLPDVPTQARDIKVEARKPGELYMTWKPPSKPNGNVSHYIVYWQPMSLNPKQFEIRNYCENRLQNYNKSISKEPEGRNKSFVDGECCTCPKTTKQQHIDEEERKFQIHFENYLQNSVFRIKKEPSLGVNIMDDVSGEDPGLDDSDKRKKRQALPSRPTTPPPGTQLGGNQFNDTTNRTKISLEYNSTWPRDDEDEEPYNYATVDWMTQIVLPDLHHFQEYSIEIIACHEYEKGLKVKLCSNRAITSARTQPSPTADIIDHRNVTSENRTHVNYTSSIRIQWPEPPQPNGIIVAYDLELRRIGIKNIKPDKFCIPHMVYREYKGYSAVNLAPGNWSFKIRATSLAGYGPWTPDLYFYVANMDTSDAFPVGLVAGVVMVGLGVVLVVVVSLVCYVNRKRGIPNHNGLYASINPDYLGAKEVYLPDEWEVDRDKVELLKELGQGSFGMVYEGIAKGIDEKQPRLKVAVKTVNEKASLKDRIEFLHEASIMKAFKCNHVVKLLGVVSIGQPTLVIMELMLNGDLKSYLRLHRPDYEGNDGRKPPSLKQIIQMAGEIADGMAYLTKEKFVHRDLAARNCMVAEDKTVKIGDFGMTRDIYETDYYRKGGKGLLPVRWMAPESLRDGVFSSQSDVWSYGVVLWEMSTLAAQPYQGFANEQVLKFVVDGNVMEKPEHCPDRLHTMMMNCWKYTPRQRPTFLEIIEELVPELDPSFRDKSFFFSDLNSSPEEEDEDDDAEEEKVSGVITPLTGSPQRSSARRLQLDSKAADRDISSDCDDEEMDFHSSQADLQSSQSSLSYQSHSRHSPPPSSLHNNQNCSHGDDEPCPSSCGGDRRCGAPVKPGNVIQLNNSKPTTTSSCAGGGGGKSLFSDSAQRWSPDSNAPPPPGVPHSNESSKGSSKSSNSNGLNGIANGHIPRLIMPDATC